jgi:hypothetical protein
MESSLELSKDSFVMIKRTNVGFNFHLILVHIMPRSITRMREVKCSFKKLRGVHVLKSAIDPYLCYSVTIVENAYPKEA